MFRRTAGENLPLAPRPHAYAGSCPLPCCGVPFSPLAGGAFTPLLSLGDLIMARRQLLNIARLAEQTAST